MHEVQLPQAWQTALTPPEDWIVVLPVVLALMVAALILIVGRRPWMAVGTAVIGTLAVGACEVLLLARVFTEGPLSMTMGRWLPPFGISLTVDVFGALFALTGAVVTLFVILFGASRAGEPGGQRYHAQVMLLLAGVTGSFLTGDLFNLYVWFEVMLVASFGLMVAGGKPVELDATLKYGFLNFLGTSLFLLALGLLYGLLGTLNMADILRVAPAANPAALQGIAALLLLAFGLKAAAFPLNAWLPAAYHAPPPVVSALLGALLTKVGAYALLRTFVAILPESGAVLQPVILLVAVVTLVLGPFSALAETNLRRAIGFILIGGIGSILAGIAAGNANAIAGSGAYIVHAMLTMAGLYLLAGLVERRTGATDTQGMGGLAETSPWLAVLFFALLLSIGGIPPFLGFWPKLLLLQGTLELGGWSGGVLTGALLLNALLTLAAGARLWSHVFWSPPRTEAAPLAPDWGWGIGVAGALTLVVVALGLWPNPLLVAARDGAGAMIDTAAYVEAVGLGEGTR
jgi:multicomponent Na+:H+ antiporter subunit D